MRIPPSPLRCAVEHSEGPELAEGDTQFMSSLMYTYMHSLYCSCAISNVSMLTHQACLKFCAIKLTAETP